MSIRHALASAFVPFALFPAGAAPLTLDEVLGAARANLDVSIAGRVAAAARADIAAADHAPLPQLSAKLSQIDLQNGLGPGSYFNDKRIDKGVGIDWTWERGNKRALRTEAARRGAVAALSDVDEIRTQQQIIAWNAFFDLLAAQGRIAELLEVLKSARQTADIAARRLSAGDVAVQDAARAAIEAQRAESDAEAAQLDLQRAQLVLAQLTGRENEVTTLNVREDWPASTTTAPSAGDGRSEADAVPDALLDRRADVRAAAERLQAAQAALAGANAQRKADVTWGASLDHIPGTSTRQVELRLSVPLVWGYRYEGEIGRAQAQLDQAGDVLDKTRRAAGIELRRLRAEVASAALRARRFEGEIVPRSRQVAERAETAYTRGALPLTDLLDARRTLRAVMLDALAARTDLAKAVGAWQLRGGAPAALAK